MEIKDIEISKLKFAEYNPREIMEKDFEALKNSIKEFGFVEPVIVNSDNTIIGGHMRVRAAQAIGIKSVPCYFVDLDKNREKILNIALNKISGDWDYDKLTGLLSELEQLEGVDISLTGFDDVEISKVFDLNLELEPAEFDMQKELEKLHIEKIEVKKGDIYQLGENRLMCGDSTKEKDVMKLMNEEKADMCFTDPPYILQYTQTKYKGKGPGFGYRRNRKYLETDKLPDNFTEMWMVNINKVQKEDFHIIVFENWKNIRTIWSEMEKYWKVRNMIVWHLENRHQGFAAKYRFFNRHDIAMIGTSNEKLKLNQEDEETELQNEYETALYATSGKPLWEGYNKGSRICPTDFIEFKANDRTSSGQGIVFGTKPIEILIPYIKVLTKRNDLVVEPFGGSGSTLIACERMKRRCYVMELVPTYCEVIKMRWEKLTSKKAIKL